MSQIIKSFPAAYSKPFGVVEPPLRFVLPNKNTYVMSEMAKDKVMYQLYDLEKIESKNVRNNNTLDTFCIVQYADVVAKKDMTKYEATFTENAVDMKDFYTGEDYTAKLYNSNIVNLEDKLYKVFSWSMSVKPGMKKQVKQVIQTQDGTIYPDGLYRFDNVETTVYQQIQNWQDNYYDKFISVPEKLGELFNDDLDVSDIKYVDTYALAGLVLKDFLKAYFLIVNNLLLMSSIKIVNGNHKISLKNILMGLHHFRSKILIEETKCYSPVLLMINNEIRGAGPLARNPDPVLTLTRAGKIINTFYNNLDVMLDAIDGMEEKDKLDGAGNVIEFADVRIAVYLYVMIFISKGLRNFEDNTVNSSITLEICICGIARCCSPRLECAYCNGVEKNLQELVNYLVNEQTNSSYPSPIQIDEYEDITFVEFYNKYKDYLFLLDGDMVAQYLSAYNAWRYGKSLIHPIKITLDGVKSNLVGTILCFDYYDEVSKEYKKEIIFDPKMKSFKKLN